MPAEVSMTVNTLRRVPAGLEQASTYPAGAVVMGTRHIRSERQPS
ncbi:hypothetical protein B0G77_5336 [Paraburkholderia sp. BL10I2N1]|nr:hypothetical protein B0G77_5336 [Paraburkholderia sp. BL10I2N1]